MTLVQELVKEGLLGTEKAASLEYEIKSSNKREEEIILERKIVSEDFLFDLKSRNLKVPLKKISPEEVPLKILELIPEESAHHYQMAAIGKKDDSLEIGMVYPEDIKAQEALEFLARQGRFSYQVFLITLTNFNDILKKYGTLKKEVTRALEELEVELKEEKITPLAQFERLVEEAPVSKIVNVLIRHAIEGKASDIHIEPTKEKARIRFRMDGVLHSSILLPFKILPAVVSRIKILSGLKIDETRIPQDGRFSVKVDQKDIDFRVSTFPTVLGEKIALRVLDPSRALVSFKELGLSGRNLRLVEKATKKPYGMILSAGPTGSGKTTTLYAILRLLNKEGVNIVTLEDPVEYFIEGVNQSQVKPEINYDFATGLRHVLRQDPDILMVGEIRDEETASLAIHAALTGHLVLSTLHTSNTLGVIPRLIDMGIKPFLLPPTLSIAIAQRLIRKLCPDCKKMAKPKREVTNLILKEIENFPSKIQDGLDLKEPFNVFEPVGCPNCRKTGYLGRIGVFEILEMTDSLSELILKEPSEPKIAQEAQSQGMITMKQDGILKVLEGITSLDEVLRVAEEK